MTRTTGHHEEPARRRGTPSHVTGDEGRADTDGTRAAAVDDADADALEDEILEEIDEELQLGLNDEELHQLVGDSSLAEPPLPDDEHFTDVERQGRVRPTPKGPPTHERLTATPEEMGARVLEGLTQTDPTESEEERELMDDLATDKELDIRGGGEEPAPEERPDRSPSSPTGSPPD